MQKDIKYRHQPPSPSGHMKTQLIEICRKFTPTGYLLGINGSSLFSRMTHWNTYMSMKAVTLWGVYSIARLSKNMA